MNEEYLWNRSGKKDEEIAGLERLLSALRYHEPTAVRGRSPVRWFLAAAAVALVGIAIFPLLSRGALTDWQLADGEKLRAGQWISTSGSSPVKIESERTGEVNIDPGSRVRLIEVSESQEHFQLSRGTMHAFIWAPPRRFVVDTPSAQTIDLGCRYSLTVSESGAGLLTVESGWVAFESHGSESFIPEGAACRTKPGSGPGIPYFMDASKTLIADLERFDERPDADILHRTLATARSKDGLTLWHLLNRTHGEQRGEVFDRLSTLLHLPESVSREAVLQGNAAAFDAAWNALNLGQTDWWRGWKQEWQPRTGVNH